MPNYYSLVVTVFLRTALTITNRGGQIRKSQVQYFFRSTFYSKIVLDKNSMIPIHITPRCIENNVNVTLKLRHLLSLVMCNKIY